MAYSRTIHVTLDTRGLSKLHGMIDPRAEKILETAARAIEKTAKILVPKDTHNLELSIHIEDKHPPLQRTVADGTEYGVFVEFGTRKMGSQPFFTPAIEAERPRLERSWGELFK